MLTMISAECIQGQFQNKYFLNNQHSLDTLLEDALKENDEFKKMERSYPMKDKRYPLGTIAKINLPQSNANKRVYLLAVVDKDESFMSENTSPDIYKKMLRNFWLQMSTYGHNESRLAISVLGIGRAGYGIDVETAIVYMVCSYIDAIKESNMVNTFAIYINWDAIEKKKLNVKKIKNI